jgi:hypothetical protein
MLWPSCHRRPRIASTACDSGNPSNSLSHPSPKRHKRWRKTPAPRNQHRRKEPEIRELASASRKSTRQEVISLLLEFNRLVGGRANFETFDLGFFRGSEKRGVPRLHGNMLPGNSFPQICVVSMSIMWTSRERHKSTYVLWFKVI